MFSGWLVNKTSAIKNMQRIIIRRNIKQTIIWRSRCKVGEARLIKYTIVDKASNQNLEGT